MNICFVSRRFFPAISGMSSYALNFVESMRDRGHRITVVSQFRRHSDKNVYRDGPPQLVTGVEIIGLPQLGEGTTGDFERDIEEIVEKIKNLDAINNFDIIHAQFAYPPGLAAMLAGKALGKPVIISIQGGDGHWFGSCCTYHRQVMKTILRNAQALIIGTKSFAQEVCENNGENPDFIVLPGATDVKLFHPWSPKERTAMRAKYNLPSDKRVIVSHGRLDWRKGVGELIDAFAQLRASDSQIHLVFAGVGPDEEALSQRIVDLGLSSSVSMLGYVNYTTAPEIYALGDLFCSPTYAEGFSNTIVEALASGLPVVSTNVIGVQDVLIDGQTALLVEAKDSAKLAIAIRRLLDDNALCSYLSRNGREAVEQRWNWNNLSEDLEKVYISVHGNQTKHNWSLESCADSRNMECRFRESPHLL